MGTSTNVRSSNSIQHGPPAHLIKRAALSIAARGRPVFPCRPSAKEPLTPHGFCDATVDPAKVNMWWNRWPDANLSIPTGSASGFLVVDVDPEHGGERSLEALEERGLPATLEAHTGGGGKHLYYRYPKDRTIRNSAGLLGPGIDVRGEGGYVVVPPSITSGPYTWGDRREVAELPDWLLEELTERQHPQKQRGAGSLDVDHEGPIPEGRRNVTLTSIAGALRAQGHEEGKIRDTLLEINVTQCEPPLPASEVEGVAHSISRYPARSAGSRPDAETLQALDQVEAEYLWRCDWKGTRWKVPRSTLVALIKAARLHGTLIPSGVRISISTRSLALAAGCSHPSVLKATRRLREAGLIRRDDSERSGINAGAFVLVTPRAKFYHSTVEGGQVGESGKTLRGLLTAPRLRWSAPRWDRIGDELVRTTISRLGKTAEHIVDLLERAGGTLELEALAEALDVTRPRDLRRRVISRLERAEVVVVGAETVSLTLDWLEALNREREISGEIDAYRRDMQRYAREREAYATQHHRKPDRAPSQEEMDAKREHAEREERELTEDEERDADAILEFERHYGPFLWNSASAKRLFYRTGRWPDAETLQKLRDYLGVTHEAV